MPGAGLDPPTATIAAMPSELADPGTLISAAPISAPRGARAWHIVYHSRAVDGRDIAVTGILMSPINARSDTPLITWAHPTTGTADQCTLSQHGTANLPMPDELLARGWAVVATDYPGLGTTDPHPYLVGASEAHAVLDAARTARSFRESGLGLDSPIAIWGFSQGGHAASFAGELAPTYAPELPIKGVILASPVSDVDRFARRAETMPDQFGVLVTIVAGFAAAYPDLDPRTVFTDEVMGQFSELENRCIGAVNDYFSRPIASMLRASPSNSALFAQRFAENRTASMPIPHPILVVQGALDDIVNPADTQAMVERFCAFGVTVDSVIVPDAKHGVMDAYPFADWLAGRFAGQAAPSTCPPA